MTKVTNRTILKGHKARLGEFDKQWLEELPKVIWAYRTTPRAGTGNTPFSLTYGCEAMIPVEIGMPTLRVQFFDEAKNEEEQKLCLDLLEERREQTLLREMLEWESSNPTGKAHIESLRSDEQELTR
ncbi:uncharacterized protein LOC126668257 [Mercurialis annua]|uniref:uncharacterized protein LOC126668257 n=1 Tax=Mercurialis annua TaxID=3986 RepID=UPI00215E0817|nr:uncharacterized protein LOC126668257 [Mercurialis annua]